MCSKPCSTYGALVVEKTSSGREYKVKDISLANFGRREIKLAEEEMPGLMLYRKEYLQSQPFKGARITGSLHMTVQTAVLIETLTTLGAEVRWCSSDSFSTQDHAAAAIAQDSAAVFAWKADSIQDRKKTLREYWWCIERALDWGTGGGPDLIVDNGGDATYLVTEGVKAEAKYKKSKKMPDPSPEDSDESQVILELIRDGLKKDPNRFQKMKERLVGISEMTDSGVKKLYHLQSKGDLFFPAINVNSSVTKSKFGKLYGYRHSLVDGLMRATGVLISGKVVIVCGYGHMGKGAAAAMKQAGGRVVVTEIDPICALQALMEGLEVQTLEDVVSKADVIINTVPTKDVVKVEDMKKMKNNSIICNIAHFQDVIDVRGLEAYPNIERITIKPHTDLWVFPETKRGIIVLAEGGFVNLACGAGHPSFVMSWSLTNVAMAQRELWKGKGIGPYDENKVYDLPRILDEKVAELHLDKLGAKLTKLSDEQAESLGIREGRPLKPANYMY